MTPTNMNIQTSLSNGDMTVTVEDAGKKFSFELTIVKQADNGIYIDYTNSSNERYNLLTVEPSGAITREVPELD